MNIATMAPLCKKHAVPLMDIKEFCHQQGELSERYSLIDMPRISQDLLVTDLEPYSADLHLTGYVDENGCCVLKGSVKASLPAICQRCNEFMQIEVTSDFILSPVADEEAAKQVPKAYEPLIVAQDELNGLLIAEEELILAQPMAAKHDIEECHVKQQDWHFEEQAPSSESPFAGLATLKQKKQ